MRARLAQTVSFPVMWTQPLGRTVVARGGEREICLKCEVLFFGCEKVDVLLVVCQRGDEGERVSEP